MHPRLILYVLGVALLFAASVCSMANQSDRFVGIHEVPPFVCDRVELVPGLAVDRSRGDLGPSGNDRDAPDEAPDPWSGSSICARSTGGWTAMVVAPASE